jgi:putative transcriptional regulator
MTVLHHPNEATLIAYTGGTLPRALHFVVGMHVDSCGACRSEIAMWEKIGGALLERNGPVEISPDLLEQTLARLDEPAEAPREIPHASREYWLGPGIRYAPMLRDRKDGTRLYQLRVKPGTRLPAHSHDGRELTYVVSGEILDGDHRYGAGDIVEADVSHEHEPRAGEQGECVCVIASEGPPQFPGLFGAVIRAII